MFIIVIVLVLVVISLIIQLILLSESDRELKEHREFLKYVETEMEKREKDKGF